MSTNAEVMAENPGGPGGHSERAESQLTGIRDARLERRAIREGWGGRSQRWKTDATPEELRALGQSMTLKDRLVLAVTTDAVSNDARIRQIAVRSGIVMEGQNQADEHLRMRLANEAEHGHGDVNVNVVGVQVQSGDVVREVLHSDHEYLSYLRSKQLADDRDAGDVRATDQSGASGSVDVGSAPDPVG